MIITKKILVQINNKNNNNKNNNNNNNNKNNKLINLDKYDNILSMNNNLFYATKLKIISTIKRLYRR
jgi:hypothetical protein